MQKIGANGARTVRIPSEVEGRAGLKACLERKMGTIDEQRWEIAAIIFGWVEKSGGKRTDLPDNSGKLTLAEFARLGIRGLRDEKTIRRYYRAAEAAGLSRPDIGREVELPPFGTAFPNVRSLDGEPEPEPTPTPDNRDRERPIPPRPGGTKRRPKLLEKIEELTHADPDEAAALYREAPESALTLIKSAEEWLAEVRTRLV